MGDNVDKELLKELSVLMKQAGNSTNVTGNVQNMVSQLIDKEGTYVGDVWNGMKHGEGIFQYNNGDRYVGEWRRDNKHGQGTYYYNDGDRYEGQWTNDLKEGKGTYYWVDGKRYEGQWVEDNRNGQGTYYYNNGDYYEGQWMNGLRHGQGIYYWENGDTEDYEYINGEIRDKEKERKLELEIIKEKNRPALQKKYLEDGYFPAICERDEEAVQFLIKRGVSINIKDQNGNTPLHYAIKYNFLDIILNLLLENGASMAIENNEGDTPLHLAAKNINAIFIIAFLKRPDCSYVLNIRNKKGETPLALALKTDFSGFFTGLGWQASEKIRELMISLGAKL